ncbi:hypothetical protein ACFLQY_02220 [Verrucomicrobiota bacterium]
MKKVRWQVLLGLILVALSALLYGIHYTLFHDAHHIWIYLVGDIAFVPIEVLLVTIIIHEVLNVREKRSMLKKLNMVIGSFFAEAGNPLLKAMHELAETPEAWKQDVLFGVDCPETVFSELERRCSELSPEITATRAELEALREFALEKREFTLGLLKNPNLLEHDRFTDLLWAVSHLLEELAARENLHDISDKDLQHLRFDIQRAYIQLAREWIAYMHHLKTDYPYLFSFAVRTNPFDRQARAELS